AQQLAYGPPMLREAGDADARGELKRDRVDLHRVIERREQPLSGLLGLRGPPLKLHGELVPAEPGEHSRVADRVVEALRDVLQDRIAELVAESVVDRLEVVE